MMQIVIRQSLLSGVAISNVTPQIAFAAERGERRSPVVEVAWGATLEYPVAVEHGRGPVEHEQHNVVRNEVPRGGGEIAVVPPVGEGVHVDNGQFPPRCDKFIRLGAGNDVAVV